MGNWLVGGAKVAFTCFILFMCFVLIGWGVEKVLEIDIVEPWRIWIAILALGLSLEIGRRLGWRKGP